MDSTRPLMRLLLLLPLLPFAACQTVGLGGDKITSSATGERVSMEEMVQSLAAYDVVFLGEEHDNDVGHRMQMEATRLLHEATGKVVLSLEQFEADVQPVLDAYLAGKVDEETFLTYSRPWPNYDPHYRPGIEWAREEGVDVLAANIPRRVARSVSRKGTGWADYSLYSPWEIWVDEPEYKELFVETMSAMGGGRHFEEKSIKKWFAAQCIKDDKMAESIVSVYDDESRPLVVHWCGKFHSDYHLGTASRVARLRPDLRIAVVTMNSFDRDDASEAGDYSWHVPEQK